MTSWSHSCQGTARAGTGLLTPLHSLFMSARSSSHIGWEEVGKRSFLLGMRLCLLTFSRRTLYHSGGRGRGKKSGTIMLEWTCPGATQ